jgi:hypothetical protein
LNIGGYAMLISNHKSTLKLTLDWLTQIHDEILIGYPEFKQLGKRLDELLKLIASKLNPEDKKLLAEYEDIWIHQINGQDGII